MIHFRFAVASDSTIFVTQPRLSQSSGGEVEERREHQEEENFGSFSFFDAHRRRTPLMYEKARVDKFAKMKNNNFILP